jgi:DNA-binding MarR family transcriptional regulator
MATRNKPEPSAAGEIDPLDVLHHVLKLNARLMQPFSTHIEKRHKVGINEFRLLMLIGRLGTTASHEIAEITGVTTMSVSRAVAALHSHGRISVTPDPANRRRKMLRLTPAGERLYRQMQPSTDKVARYLFESLEPGEMLEFDRLVRTLIDSLEARDEAGRSLFIERTRPDDENRNGEGSRGEE